MPTLPIRAACFGGCLLAGALAHPVAAQSDAVTDLQEVILVGDVEAPPVTSHLDADDLNTRHAGEGLPGLLRGMAGVTTQGGFGEDGETAINIRGLQDHGRVAVSVDGMRQNFARAGHGANGSFAIDTELLRAVTVTRGPGAAAGAIGGAVEMRSVTAEDLVPEGATQGGEVTLRYGDLTARPTLHAALAARLGDSLDLTVAATQSGKADFTAPDGTTVHAAQTTQSHLATLGLTTEGGQRLTLGLSALTRDYITGRMSGTPRSNRLSNDSLALSYHAEDLMGGWSLEGRLYQTGTHLAQRNQITGLSRAYDTTTTGLRLVARKEAEIAGRLHGLTLRLEGFRDRITTDDPAGASLTPSGSRAIWSLDAEDRVEIGAATLTLGISADRYALDSTAGQARGTALSPRLALDLPLSDSLTLHAAAALAYRPPSLSETLVDGQHPEPADFPVRPNPGLAPERARNLELGLGYASADLLASGDSLSLKATTFRTQVQDYIGMIWVGGVFNGYYQYDNIDRVRIDGIELDARYETEGGAFLSLAGQTMRSTVQGTGAQMSRAMPDRLTLTLGHRSPDDARELGARLTHSAAKVEGSYASGSWKTVDLFLRQDLTDSASLTLSLNNIFDEAYTPHLETQPAPGINAQASLTLRF